MIDGRVNIIEDEYGKWVIYRYVNVLRVLNSDSMPMSIMRKENLITKEMSKEVKDYVMCELENNELVNLELEDLVDLLCYNFYGVVNHIFTEDRDECAVIMKEHPILINYVNNIHSMRWLLDNDPMLYKYYDGTFKNEDDVYNILNMKLNAKIVYDEHTFKYLFKDHPRLIKSYIEKCIHFPIDAYRYIIENDPEMLKDFMNNESTSLNISLIPYIIDTLKEGNHLTDEEYWYYKNEHKPKGFIRRLIDKIF